jgi:hypothetical protein
MCKVLIISINASDLFLKIWIEKKSTPPKRRRTLFYFIGSLHIVH